MMKTTTRLSALALAVLLLFMAVVGCTSTPTAQETTAADTPSDTTAPGTDSDTTVASDTVTDTESDSVSDSESETDAPTPDDGTDAPGGYIRLFKPDELLEIKQQNLSCRTGTYGEDYAYISCTPTELDPWFTLARSEKTAVKNARYMRIKYRTSNADMIGRLFLGEKGISEEGALAVRYTADGEWHTLVLDLARSATYSENLRYIRFDTSDGLDAAAETLDIAWIGFYPPNQDPSEGLPALPEDAPDLSAYDKTPDGSAYYRASGALSGDNGTYTFKEGFRLDVYRRGYFNRYTLGYSSSAPIRGEITYLVWDEEGKRAERTETFFLEAGQNQSFSSLIDDYTAFTCAWGITGLSMKTCDGSTATFTLRSITDEATEVHNGTYYLENDRYKLGILLSWGGGISYIEDKQDGDDRLGNLINRADPGRLVQQSYYGIKSGQGYTPGNYNGTEWRYNPVQGGDMYGNGSKLVDFQILEDGRSVYIKCRPMDWAKNNEPTPSYMENTYTLAADGIRVSNRFVDFSGYRHPAYHAELPAFYTVSHLGTFHYYNGTKPWTGDTYISLPNEPFWAGNKNAYHEIVKGNTETWAAWTNTAGYGIGLYVPGVEEMLAGRYEYNGSKDPANGGTSYVAPLRTITMVSYVPFEYDYIIATGTIAEMRETFKSFAN